jgi:hypothetical protein
MTIAGAGMPLLTIAVAEAEEHSSFAVNVAVQTSGSVPA